MKKSLMWMLTAVMAVTFVALLYFQIMYLENMVKMRDEQFTEGVMRSLNTTSEFLEKQETLFFLEQDVNIIESSLYDSYDSHGDTNLKYSVENPDGSVTKYTLSSEVEAGRSGAFGFPSATQNVGARYGTMQEVIRSQYLYQKGLLNEVILSILRDSSTRPIMERADSTIIRNCLSAELANNGVNVPFAFALINPRNDVVYTTGDYRQTEKDVYSIPIFSNTNSSYTLRVQFPTKNTFIFKSVRFIIPTLAFTVILLVIFVYTLILAFRQKNLAEMKTDFINNMTHELKTPISTISLAGQMLSDPSIRKSQSSLTHLSEVIVEESKRLRFQVEKVLQLSILDKTGSTLKFTEVNANSIIYNVVNTFKLKVEKQGGTLDARLDALEAEISVDEMQFTNVIFNLLDNALKYMKEDEEPRLEIATSDITGNRLEIRIADNGIGIKKEDAKHIFEKFYRVSTGNRHDVKGFGLGLAYVKKMITAFGGTITVESEFGKGSVFIITLPLAGEEK
ncbi:MAG: HAMP domain-containing histidine kinase [Muribaculaceae bacterium]|nr:HAMP domain-containing histidine kinase [Muribaculaceae bacterium]